MCTALVTTKHDKAWSTSFAIGIEWQIAFSKTISKPSPHNIKEIINEDLFLDYGYAHDYFWLWHVKQKGTMGSNVTYLQ